MERPSELFQTSVFMENVHQNTVASRMSAKKRFMVFLKQLPGRVSKDLNKDKCEGVWTGHRSVKISDMPKKGVLSGQGVLTGMGFQWLTC